MICAFTHTYILITYLNGIENDMDNIACADRLSVPLAYIMAPVPQLAIIERPAVTSVTESLKIECRVSLMFHFWGGWVEGGVISLASNR